MGRRESRSAGAGMVVDPRPTPTAGGLPLVGRASRHATTAGRRAADDERGSMAVELAILTIPLVIILLFVVGLGRVSEARSSVDEAARDAARTASIARSAVQAGDQGRQAALADLAADGVSCQAPAVTIDTADLRPGGRVTATVVCVVSFGDLLLLHLPGRRTISSTAVEVVDVYRGS